MKSTLMIMAALMMVLAASCGKSPEQRAVEESYLRVVEAIETGNNEVFFAHLTSNTVEFLDRLVASLRDLGMGDFRDGKDMMAYMLEDGAGFEFNRRVSSVTIRDDRAVLVTAIDREEVDFILEDGVWKLDLEDVMREGMEEGLEGTGVTLDQILEGNIR